MTERARGIKGREKEQGSAARMGPDSRDPDEQVWVAGVFRGEEVFVTGHSGIVNRRLTLEFTVTEGDSMSARAALRLLAGIERINAESDVRDRLLNPHIITERELRGPGESPDPKLWASTGDFSNEPVSVYTPSPIRSRRVRPRCGGREYERWGADGRAGAAPVIEFAVGGTTAL